jgi:hypothetical protein
MGKWVQIEFDCIPLRSITRWDAPLDASPEYERLLRAIQKASEKHGLHNTYYLHHAHCIFRLTNHDELGMIEFQLHGVVLTDPDDRRTKGSDLEVTLVRETCSWLTEPVVQWFAETVARAVELEFDRYIEAGDLARTQERIQQIEAQSDEQGGYLGMFL